MSTKILAVHSYGFIDKHNLGVQSETVCKRVLKIQSQFDEIVLLGGWHDKNQSPTLTGGELMKEWLLDASIVDSKKIHTFKSLGYSGTPPRDTAEEIDLLVDIAIMSKLPCLKEALGSDNVYAIGLWYHIPRIKLLYRLKLQGLGRVKMVPAFSWQTVRSNQWSRIAQEPIGLFINWLDPHGRSQFIQNLRKQRTHSGSTA